MKVKTVTVHQDNLSVAGLITEGTIDTVVFDPPFSSLYEYGDYSSFLKKRIDIISDKLTDDANFISVNYDDGQDIIQSHLEDQGLRPSWNLSIRRNPRGNALRFPYLRISNFTKHYEGPIRQLSLGDAHHKPGNNGINEGMPMWEIEGILHYADIGTHSIVLDMFGGSGAVALATHAYGAECICIEQNFDRYNRINERLLNYTSGEHICNMRTCEFSYCNYGGIGLCPAHYRKYQYYELDNRPMFLGTKKNGETLTTTSYELTECISEAERLARRAYLWEMREEREEKIKEFEETLNTSLTSSQIFNGFIRFI